MQTYFVIKYNYHKNFPKGTIVRFITNTFNESNLVENINTGERIWLMCYELYPIVDHDFFLDWAYDINNQAIIPSEYYIIKNDNKVVKLLNDNLNDWIVLDLDTNKEIIINKNSLIEATKYIKL
jgi:hypothetical protein